MANVAKMAALLATGAGTALALRALRHRDPLDFRGRVVLITGGSRGLGLVMARQLAAEGAKLALLARTAADLDRAAGELRRRGAEVLTIPCDVQDQERAQAAVDQVVAHFGQLDVLINCAGIIQAGPLENMEVADFEQAMGVHFRGPLYTMLAAIPHLRTQGGGRIVNIASIGGQVAVPHLMPYSASKFALVGLSDGMRAELAKDDIYVTTVCPWLMRTGSPPNALFKGNNRAEYSWFALAALPGVSVDARVAAHQIIEACRAGAPELTIGVQARLLTLARAVAPALLADALAVVNRLLPAPVSSREGNVARTGWESASPIAPSVLTRLSDIATVQNNELRGHAPPDGVSPALAADPDPQYAAR